MANIWRSVLIRHGSRSGNISIIICSLTQDFRFWDLYVLTAVAVAGNQPSPWSWMQQVRPKHRLTYTRLRGCALSWHLTWILPLFLCHTDCFIWGSQVKAHRTWHYNFMYNLIKGRCNHNLKTLENKHNCAVDELLGHVLTIRRLRGSRERQFALEI